jgi:hypothetical protein
MEIGILVHTQRTHTQNPRSLRENGGQLFLELYFGKRKLDTFTGIDFAIGGVKARCTGVVNNDGLTPCNIALRNQMVTTACISNPKDTTLSTHRHNFTQMFDDGLNRRWPLKLNNRRKLKGQTFGLSRQVCPKMGERGERRRQAIEARVACMLNKAKSGRKRVLQAIGDAKAVGARAVLQHDVLPPPKWPPKGRRISKFSRQLLRVPKGVQQRIRLVGNFLR